MVLWGGTSAKFPLVCQIFTDYKGFHGWKYQDSKVFHKMSSSETKSSKFCSWKMPLTQTRFFNILQGCFTSIALAFVALIAVQLSRVPACLCRATSINGFRIVYETTGIRLAVYLSPHVKLAPPNIEAKKAKYWTPVTTKKRRQFCNKYRHLFHEFLMKASLTRRI